MIKITFLYNLDKGVLFFIQRNLHIPILDKIMILATYAGDKGLIWLLIAFLLLINKKTRYIGLMTMLVMILVAIIGEGILKHIFQRPRPYDEFPLVHLLIGKYRSFSFPSGHAASSFAAAYVLSKYLRKLALAFWTVAIMIAFSRIYLFMHYPSDVLAGIILGLICGMVGSYLYEHKIKDKIYQVT